jgi:hypothetical protein
LVRLKIVLMLTQDRYTVYAKRTIGFAGDVGHVGSCFGPFGEMVLASVQDRYMVCAKRTITSKIVFDGTPR